MDVEKHFRRLEKMYLKSNVNQSLYESTEALIESKKATISIEISEKYFHALGAIHGSIYFKLLDDAAFFAANSVVTDKFLLTSNFNISLVRPANKGKITAIGTLNFQSKNLFIASSSLLNEQGKEIAFGTGHFMKSQIDLTEEIGYHDE